MSGTTAALVVFVLLFLLALAGLILAVPAWFEERQRRRASEASAERLRQRVREVRAEADAVKDALSRCQAAAEQAAAAARKAGDTVALANELIAEASRAPAD